MIVNKPRRTSRQLKRHKLGYICRSTPVARDVCDFTVSKTAISFQYQGCCVDDYYNPSDTDNNGRPAI